MRILHIYDWNLGQQVMGKTLQTEHEAFMAWLIDQIGQHPVDAVIVASNIFNTGVTLVVLGGSHDSVATLGESRTLL